jgi:LmbE family N-acetylglucosaminyl deacetylase
MKILVVVAHPDDEVLGCGGTIAKYSQNGDEVYVLILGEGVTSRYLMRKGFSKKELVDLKKEALKANKILRIKKTCFCNFPDNRLDTVALLDIVKQIEKVKSKIMPEVVYTHHRGDLNIDHQITFNAVLTACRPIKGETVKEIYSFEIPSSTEWSFYGTFGNFTPNVFIDISDTIDKKVEAMKCYESELCEYPHPRSLEGIRIIAKRWGLVVGKKEVEPFILIRQIKG